jgi:hypothetical protein
MKINKINTVDKLINKIYEHNYSHIEFNWNMGGEECKCFIHKILNTLIQYRDKGTRYDPQSDL